VITGAPDVVSSYVTEQLSEEFNWQEAAGLKTPPLLLLEKVTITPWIEPVASETVTVQVVGEPAATEAG